MTGDALLTQRDITETILDYDPKRMELTYVATTGMPWFVASARNTWQVHPHDSSTATVTIAAEVEPKATRGSGALVAAMTPAFTRLGRITLDDLKHFIETGEPSPRKRKRRRR